MAFTYGTCERQVSNLLGLIAGTDMATVGTNYSATASTSNRQNPDFPIPAVQDAIVNSITDIALAIAETPRHPERANLVGSTVSLANRGAIPANDSLGSPFIGVKGRVYDFSTGKACIPIDVGRVRSYNELSSTLYSGLSLYYYAYDGSTIEHTRTAVAIEGCVWVRPTYSTASNVGLDDIHETAVVAGAVMRLCPREAQYLDLWTSQNTIWTDHLNRIRALGGQDAITTVNGAPSFT